MDKFNKYTRSDVQQKILNTLYDKLDIDVSAEDIDYMALTLLRLKENEERVYKETDPIISGSQF